MTQPPYMQRIKQMVSTLALDEVQAALLFRTIEEGLPTSAEIADTKPASRDASMHAMTTLAIDDSTVPPPPPRCRVGIGERFLLPKHLDDGGLLTVGGMGEIRRVYDRCLRRYLVMKVLRLDLKENATAIERFANEAQVTAQLEHPGIVPVHEMGSLPDGRPFFTMREVRGRTLETVIRAVHTASTTNRWGVAPCGWTFRKMLLAFRQVCEAVSYAHSRDVVHRDLKPANILVGDYGVVQVVDWGLAKILGRPSVDRTELAVETDRSESGSHITQVGLVAGTVAYMPPEQAKGQLDTLDTTADVYSLGAILYEILCGFVPYEGRDWDSVWNKVLAGPPKDLRTSRQRVAPPIPIDLADICDKAMSRESKDRFLDARRLVNRIVGWMDGEERRKRALRVVKQARDLLPRAQQLKEDAVRLRSDSEDRLAELEKWASVSDKRPAWELADRADAMEREAALEEARFLQMAQGALTHDPDLLEARKVLAEYYRAKHQEAEKARKPAAAAHFESLLEAQGDIRQVDYLSGSGRLSLLTERPGARVSLFEYKLRDRRLEPVFLRTLGTTPIIDQMLMKGSYLLRIEGEGCEVVDYPVYIDRNQSWDGVPPGEGATSPIKLPPIGGLPSESQYIPEGWFRAGGDPNLSDPTPVRSLWVDAFVMRKHPVTNGEFLAFLNDLIRREDFSIAEALQPREWTGSKDKTGMPIYHRRSDGTFALGRDKDGHLWRSDWPVVLVNMSAATAYAAWYAGKTGKRWRLPREYEWEKAARGVDGRLFPWGSFFDPTWANTRESSIEQLLQGVGEQTNDVSPYGVWGLAGNVMDWTSEPYQPRVRNSTHRIQPLSGQESSQVVARGGAWSLFHGGSRAASRWSMPVEQSTPMLGFRLVYSLNR